MTGTALQYLLVGLLLAWSLWRVARQFMPKPRRGDGDCGSGCDSCGSCAPTTPPPDTGKAVGLRGKMADSTRHPH